MPDFLLKCKAQFPSFKKPGFELMFREYQTFVSFFFLRKFRAAAFRPWPQRATKRGKKSRDPYGDFIYLNKMMRETHFVNS